MYVFNGSTNFLEGCLGYPLSEDGTQMIYPELCKTQIVNNYLQTLMGDTSNL